MAHSHVPSIPDKEEALYAFMAGFSLLAIIVSSLKLTQIVTGLRLRLAHKTIPLVVQLLSNNHHSKTNPNS